MLAWREDPADPDRPLLSHPAVGRLAAQIAPGSRATDLGGVMSLNVGLHPAGLVLRVHQPFATRPWLLARQAVRRALVPLGAQGRIASGPGTRYGDGARRLSGWRGSCGVRSARVRRQNQPSGRSRRRAATRCEARLPESVL
jgi:hypothetical protein